MVQFKERFRCERISSITAEKVFRELSRLCQFADGGRMATRLSTDKVVIRTGVSDKLPASW